MNRSTNATWMEPRTRTSCVPGLAPAHLRLAVPDSAETAFRTAAPTPTGSETAPRREKHGSPPPSGSGLGVRRTFFRAVRILLAAGLVYGVTQYARIALTTVESDLAWIDAEKVVVRTPIVGQVQMESFQPGTALSQGARLFSVSNARFGNTEATARLAWASEYEDRLSLEAAEAAIRHEQQDKIFQRFQNLHAEKLMAEIDFLEEQTKWEMARTAMTTKREQLERARERRLQAEAQVTLQQVSTVTMPFDGVVWSVQARDGQHLSSHEPVCQIINPERVWIEALLPERHAGRVFVGTLLKVSTSDGSRCWQARVESIRGVAGQSVEDSPALAASLVGAKRRQMAVRLSMESANPYGATECFGVGRSVKVSLAD